MDNCIRGIPYVEEAIEAKKWIKVTDYLRMYYLYSEGGIYLDCDIKILKPFDELLNSQMFVCRETDTVIANSVIGAEKGHPLLESYLEKVNNFNGGGDMVFEPAERLFTDLVLGRYGEFSGIVCYSRDYFFPETEKAATKNTFTFHNFTRSWR